MPSWIEDMTGHQTNVLKRTTQEVSQQFFNPSGSVVLKIKEDKKITDDGHQVMAKIAFLVKS